MSSADSPRFDATAAAQQMLDLEAQAEQPSLPAQQRAATTVVHEPSTQSGRPPRAAHRPRQRQAVRGDVR